jgi:hypothetical protein
MTGANQGHTDAPSQLHQGAGLRRPMAQQRRGHPSDITGRRISLSHHDAPEYGSRHQIKRQLTIDGRGNSPRAMPRCRICSASGMPLILNGHLPTSRPITTRPAATRRWRATNR